MNGFKTRYSPLKAGSTVYGHQQHSIYPLLKQASGLRMKKYLGFLMAIKYINQGDVDLNLSPKNSHLFISFQTVVFVTE